MLLCIDVEPDEKFIDRRRGARWRGFDRAVPFLAQFRDRACVVSDAPARFSWLLRMDPQITVVHQSPSWLAERYPVAWQDLIAAGDDLGLHVHTFRWLDGAGRWSMGLDDQSWIDECMYSAAAAFRSSFGKPCRTFRSGDHWMSEATMNTLQDLGASYDLSVEPGLPALHASTRRPAEGLLPDYTMIPRVPYRPSRDDYRVPDPWREDGVIMIPMTTAAIRTPLRVRVRDEFARRASPKLYTAILTYDTLIFRRVVTAALEQRDTSHLALPVQTGALASTRHLNRAAANLEWLLAHPRARDFRWVTAHDAMTIRGGAVALRGTG